MNFQSLRRSLFWAGVTTTVISIVHNVNFHVRYNYRLGNGASPEQLRELSWSWQGWMAGVAFLVALATWGACAFCHYKLREVNNDLSGARL
jgi:uncharacterized membrane protein